MLEMKKPRWNTKRGFFVKINGVPFVTIAGILEGHDSIAIPFLTDEGIIAEVALLYCSGLGIPQISKRLKIARSTVRNKLTRAGISFQEEKGIQNPLSKRNSGKPRWNSPYGLMYVDGKLVPHPQEFEVLRLYIVIPPHIEEPFPSVVESAGGSYGLGNSE
ncbi:MAG: hypothetical protein NDJ89_13405, partial [Oligoflexia bacterium]|nr:hypothetical protein [Oligoflexia bacterium]